MDTQLFQLMLRNEVACGTNTSKEIVRKLLRISTAKINNLTIVRDSQSRSPYVNLLFHPIFSNDLLFSRGKSFHIYNIPCDDSSAVEARTITLEAIKENCEHVLWYPQDMGLIAASSRSYWNLIDTENQELVLQISPDDSVFKHFDWNNQNSNIVALVQRNDVRIFDLRTGQLSLTSLTIPGKYPGHPTRTLWHIQDERGLFLANKHGFVFYYDTRILNKPLTKARPNESLLDQAIVDMQLDPAYRQLITLNEGHQITQWNLRIFSGKPKIRDSEVHFEPCSREMRKPFVTESRIYTCRYDQNNRSLNYLDRSTGMSHPFVSTNFYYSSIVCATGRGRTRCEDDLNPTIILCPKDAQFLGMCLLFPTQKGKTICLKKNQRPQKSEQNAWSDDET